MSISNVKEFALKPDVDRTLYYAESVSVNIKKIIKRAIEQVKDSKYQRYCDLIGKLVLMNRSGRHINAIRLKISFEDGCKNNIKMTLR